MPTVDGKIPIDIGVGRLSYCETFLVCYDIAPLPDYIEGKIPCLIVKPEIKTERIGREIGSQIHPVLCIYQLIAIMVHESKIPWLHEQSVCDSRLCRGVSLNFRW